MTVHASISPAPALAGQDFAALRAEGLRLVQRYAGASWTDYNAHDPGVTTLEQLCYALTDLSYRTALPVADLLAGPDGAIDLRRHGLERPARALSGGPVTASDFRRLLIDRTPGLANAWLTPVAAPGLPGLYDIQLYAPSLGPDAHRRGRRLREHALRVFVRRRGLCEDARRVTLLRPARTVVSARVVIGGDRPAETVMAELLFRLGLALAPEPRRRSLAERLAEGRPPSEVFDGPLLRHGFIDDADLTPRPDHIGWSEMVRTLAACPDVEGLDQVSVWLEGQVLTPATTLAIPDDAIPRLDAGLHGADLPLVLIRGDQVCGIDRTRVRHELARLRAAHRRPAPLAADYARAFPPPSGSARDLAHHVPVRATYPGVYGVGPHGPPDDASPRRRAEALQLRGYLAVFDQLMADHLARVAHIPDLFSIAPRSEHGHLHPPLEDAEVLIPGRDAEPVAPEALAERRGRVLDVLLALRGEPGGDRSADPETALADRRRRLAAAARAGARRSQGLDYLTGFGGGGAEAAIRQALGYPAAQPGEPHRFHLIEHALLRAGRRRRRRGRGFDYDLTVSAVFNLPRAERDTPRERARLARIVRDHVPAHVAVEVRFVTADWRLDFDLFHHAWRMALRSRRPRPIILTSVALRELLLDLRMERPT